MRALSRKRVILIPQPFERRATRLSVFVIQGWTPSMKRIILPCVVGVLIFFGSGAVLQIPMQISAQQRNPPPAEALVQLSDRFESIASKVLPAVVSVEAVKSPKANAPK